ncbi:MAG: ABC transporter ATP-binding protein [Syntrophales bacterium]|nr:ABC transporter ATP-binding protein [Syntrophales bacterium]
MGEDMLSPLGMEEAIPDRPVVEARNLRKTFGAFVAVDDVSFDVMGGECFGILGPNGAGKTTTIRMIYGFSPLTSGSLRVFGMDIATEARRIKALIGVCQQDNTLDPELSVLENLLVFARFFHIEGPAARRRAEELLSFMSLGAKRHSRVLELSGGMVRRVLIARALINDPALLILDEPTTGLDPQSRHQVWERLRELKVRGISILLTTHYMDEAFHLCDRLIIMDHGRILVGGPPSQLVRDHVGRHVLEIAAPSTELRTYLAAQGIKYEDLGHRLVIHDATANGLYGAIQHRFCNEDCTLRMATLEDVFLKLTGRDLRE